MLYSISWFLVFALFALWSTSVWVLHSLAVWSLIGVGSMVGSTQQIDHLLVPGWVSHWIPSDVILAFKASIATALPWVESALSALPSVAGWFAPLAWIVWGFGVVILAVGAVALHWFISQTGRSAGPGQRRVLQAGS